MPSPEDPKALPVEDLQREQVARWEQRWSDRSFKPLWRFDGLPPPLVQALDDGWLSGRTVIDIGCGVGPIAAALEERGFEVLGVDCSSQAIARARKRFQGRPGLKFEVVDVTSPWAPPARFDMLIDRGCLHGIPPLLVGGYVGNVAAWSNPGAHFLLLAPLGRGNFELSPETVRELFAPAFELVETRNVEMGGPNSSGPLPGAAYRLVRTATGV